MMMGTLVGRIGITGRRLVAMVVVVCVCYLVVFGDGEGLAPTAQYGTGVSDLVSGKEGRNEERKEGRKEGRKDHEGRGYMKEGRKDHEGRGCMKEGREEGGGNDGGGNDEAAAAAVVVVVMAVVIVVVVKRSYGSNSSGHDMVMGVVAVRQ